MSSMWAVDVDAVELEQKLVDQLPQTQCLSWAVIVGSAKSPAVQFLVMLAAWAVYHSLPDDLVQIIQSLLPQFWFICKAVAVLQFVQFLAYMKQWMARTSSDLEHVATTSQVVATRSNILEWRSCLEFASKWHNCSLQCAYDLWQQSGHRCPPCPASQSFRLSAGVPLSPIDQWIAVQDQLHMPESIEQYDYKLSVAWENYLLAKNSQSSMTPPVTRSTSSSTQCQQ